MTTQVIPGYGKVSIHQYLGNNLKRYLCRWVKTYIAKHRVFARNYYCGREYILAPDIDTAIQKAIELKGFKPNLIQRV